MVEMDLHEVAAVSAGGQPVEAMKQPQKIFDVPKPAGLGNDVDRQVGIEQKIAGALALAVVDGLGEGLPDVAT